MDPLSISFIGAFGAGVLSFISPCVLPLIPAYLCFLGCTSMDELTAEGGVDKHVQRKVFISAIAFVLGFSTVFTILGASATAISDLVAGNIVILSQIAGVVIVILGLHYMGAFRINFLNLEKRFHIKKRPTTLLGAYGIGLAFALGWTPCVGPILATILMIAASQGDISYGISLLATYAAGLGLPFLAAAFAVKPFMKFISRFSTHMYKVKIGIGILLVVTGIAIFTGTLAEVSNWFLLTFPILGNIG